MQRKALEVANLKYLQKYIDDASLKEIHINKIREIELVYLDDTVKFIEDKNLTLSYLRDFLTIFSIPTGRRFGRNNPIVAFSIGGEHRVQAVSGKFTGSELAISIRFKRNKFIELQNFIISEEDQKLIKEAINTKKNILIIGDTGTGKTTFLNAILAFIEDKIRIITIENVKEIVMPKNISHLDFYYQDNKASDEIPVLIDSALRMSPARIIFGELRIDNTAHFVSCLKKGHAGTIATIHANDEITVFQTIRQNVGYKTSTGSSQVMGSDAFSPFVENIEDDIDLAIVLTRYKEGEEIKVKAKVHKYKK